MPALSKAELAVLSAHGTASAAQRCHLALADTAADIRGEPFAPLGVCFKQLLWDRPTTGLVLTHPRYEQDDKTDLEAVYWPGIMETTDREPMKLHSAFREKKGMAGTLGIFFFCALPL